MQALFDFEDLGPELARPPFAAIRFLRTRGMKLPLRAWEELPIDVRWAITKAGAQDQIDRQSADALMRLLPLREIEMIDPIAADAPPSSELARALRVQASFLEQKWPSLRPFQRFTLNVLRHNTRLLWRAFDEILGFDGEDDVFGRGAWVGMLGHAKLALSIQGGERLQVMTLLTNNRLLDGRAFVLAEASGRRAARGVTTVFDLHSMSGVGPIELGYAIDPGEGVLWQAHVSTEGGEFFPLASLVAASAAALCLCDMIKEFDPGVSVTSTQLKRQHWRVARHEGPLEAATRVY